MDDVLAQISSNLELCNETVGVPSMTTEILLVESLFSGQNLLNLVGKNLVLDLLTIEEF
jgi:hypothetical protein